MQEKNRGGGNGPEPNGFEFWVADMSINIGELCLNS